VSVKVVKYKELLAELKYRLRNRKKPVKEASVIRVNTVIVDYLDMLKNEALNGNEVVMNYSKNKLFGIFKIEKKLFYQVNRTLKKFFHVSTKRLGWMYHINITECRTLSTNGYYFISDKNTHKEMEDILTETDLIYSI
jgi:hypothetical protein